MNGTVKLPLYRQLFSHMTPHQPREDDAREDDAHSSSDDEAGTEFSDYVALDDAARRPPADAWRRGDATAAPALDDALRRPRFIKPPPPPPPTSCRRGATSVCAVPQRPPCAARRWRRRRFSSRDQLPNDAVDALDEATAADVVLDHGEKVTTSIAHASWRHTQS